MKFKFYLRGIGSGVILTAIILHFALAGKMGEPMTDEEIKVRAASLGMIENTVLVSANSAAMQEPNKDTEQGTSPEPSLSVSPTEVPIASPTAEPTIAPTASPTVEPTVAPTATPTVAPTATPTAVPTATATPKPTATPTPKPTATPTPKPTATPTVAPTSTPTPTPASTVTGDEISIAINPGDGSYIVAKRCADAGLVSSAAEYDMYLCNNNYDKRLVVGNHKIKKGASEEEIAKNLTSAVH